MKHKTNSLARLSSLTLTFLLGGIIGFAQAAPQNVSGKYEGMVKMPNHGEEKVTLELKSEGARISGRAIHGNKTVEVSEGKLENDTLTLTFDKEKSFIAKVDGDKLVGELMDSTHKIPVEFKKVTPAGAAFAAAPAAPAAAAASASAAAPLDLSGQWEAVADANGNTVPFLLTLKVDGETVSGSSSSQLGEATIKSGTWKDGKLVFELEGQSGVIAMSATVIDGKLAGEFDFAGQAQGKWVAVKKN